MTPGDLAEVEGSWRELVACRAQLLDALTERFTAAGVPSPASRAVWLLDAVAELVGLLSSPSVLSQRASAVVAGWPDPSLRPSYAVDGRAWMGAAGDCLTTWSPATEASWKQGWLLISEILVAETLSPFCDP